jgi:hypothetical protein
MVLSGKPIKLKLKSISFAPGMPKGSQPKLKIAPVPKLNTSFNPESMKVN